LNYLFVHQNFPGQFLHIARHLGASGEHQVVFITEGNAQNIPGVRKVAYRRPAPAAETTHAAAREFDLAARRAEAVARAAATLKELGFQPDIVIGHHGWGELLNIRDVWPDVPLLGYFEFFYRTVGADVGFDPEFPTTVSDHARIRAKNNVNLQALALGGHGQTPTQWQLSTYPAWARSQISVLAEGVHLDVCTPDPDAAQRTLRIGDMTVGPGEKLVTYAARDLEPYRGFHIMMRAIPTLLAARPDVRIAMVGGDGVSYGAPPRNTTWRAKLQKEIGKGIDPAREIGRAHV
jgi:glycosyltransferase involved in cell wall biosynthesis